MIHDIKIKYHAKDMQRIEKIDKGDWIDLRAAEDYEIMEGQFKLINLGVSIKIPKGYEAHLAPRSSTFKNYGIIQTNGVGIIDESYCGEGDVWMMPVKCIEGREKHSEIPYSVIKKNDRICQFRLLPKMELVRIIEVDSMEEASRGGFGSTGVR